jgi:hypothetical protein
MTPNWTTGIVGQITNHAATPNQALHLTGGACSVFVNREAAHATAAHSDSPTIRTINANFYNRT